MFNRIKKIFSFDFMTNAIDFTSDLQRTDSKIKCQECHMILPLFRLIMKMKSVRDGETIKFKCAFCKHENTIKKEVKK